MIAQMLLLSLNLSAIPAYPHPVTVTQPDGSNITVILKGDERTKWAQTLDGYTLMYNAKGIYEYATLDSKSNMVPSGIKATEISKRTTTEKEFLSKTSKGLFYSKSQRKTLKTLAAIYDNEAKQKAFPTSGSRKLVCILMGFKDKAFTKSQSDFNNLFNQIGYSAGSANGSVRDYYKQNSYDQLDLTVTVAGPYTAANNLSYYGTNDASGYDKNPRALVTEAVNLADADVNYANFDNDADGTVDGVYVIFAGYGEEAGGGANCIWSHAWSIPSVVKDGKYINSYSCSPELRGNSGSNISAIGVICHEFGHVLGAPDYYDADYSTGGQFLGTGDWDMMASGSWNDEGDTPAQHNAFTKIYMYNWATATTLSSPTTVTVKKAETDKSFYRIDSKTTNEYWLIENRQQVGFDAKIPGHGLLIYHVHKNVLTSASTNVINNTYPQQMYPVCANATTNPGSTASSYGSINSAGCSFPGSSNKTSFTDATIPNMNSWAGANTGKPITNIVENTSTGIVTFTFMNVTGSTDELSYCESQGNNANYEWISSVTIGSFTNSSSAAGYTDFTSKTISLSSGQSTTLELIPEFSSTLYTEYWKVWIDYNEDGDFDDEGEEVFSGTGSSAVSGSFTVADVTVKTRMRISMKYKETPTSCETFSYGEVEDYTVDIIAGGGTSVGCSGGINSYPYNESFESTSLWSNQTDDDLDWTVTSGSTPSSSTGPSSAYDGTNYIYCEVSSPGYPTKRAILQSPCFDLSGLSSAYFNFMYHMYGSSSMGTLDVEVSEDNGSTWKSLWSKSGNQGNIWLSANINLSSYIGKNIQLRFNTISGTTWQGDIAIDDIYLSSSIQTRNICKNIDEYSSSKTYSEGDFVTYQGDLYKKTTNGWSKIGSCSSASSPSFASPNNNSLVKLPGSDNTEFEASVYPNPLSGSTLNISVNRTDLTYSVINLMGQKVDNGTLEGNTIRVNNLPDGIYFLELTSGDTTKKLRFIKE
jgi:M6 family metalloprotease-like protein